MRIRIIALGHRMPEWVRVATDDYRQRMPRESPVELLELKPEGRSTLRTRDQVLDAEAARILAALPKRGIVVALDERGELWRTQDLAHLLEQAAPHGTDLTFVIGSADGLHDRIKSRADHLLSLSRLTLPHGLVRVLLAEQLYRADSLLKNHPYHRE